MKKIIILMLFIFTSYDTFAFFTNFFNRFTEQPKVEIACTPEEQQKFFPPSTSGSYEQSRICKPLSLLNNLLQKYLMGKFHSDQRRMIINYEKELFTNISPACWKAIATSWENYTVYPESFNLSKRNKENLVDAFNFLQVEIPFLMNKLLKPVEVSSKPNQCYRLVDLTGRTREDYRKKPKYEEFAISAENILLQLFESNECNNELINDELELISKRKLYGDHYRKGYLFTDCNPYNQMKKPKPKSYNSRIKAGSMFYSGRLEKCMDIERNYLGQLENIFIENNYNKMTYDDCLDAFKSTKSYFSKEVFDDLYDKVSLCLKENRSEFQECWSFKKSCDQYRIRVVENQSTSICNLPDEYGHQLVSGTCAFHGIQALIHMESRFCNSPESFSIGQLQKMSGLQDHISKLSGLDLEKIDLLKKKLDQKGIKIIYSNDHKSKDGKIIIPKTEAEVDDQWIKSQLPGMFSVSVRKLATGTLERLLIDENSKNVSEASLHGILITSIVIINGKKTAVVRDPNFLFKPKFIPLDKFISSVNFYKDKMSYKTGFAPTYVKIENRKKGQRNQKLTSSQNYLKDFGKDNIQKSK